MAQAAEHTVFSKLSDLEMGSLEMELVYFFGATHPEAVSEPYSQALKALESLKIHSPENQLKSAMIPQLEKAYKAVHDQTNLNFDVLKAAEFECELILAQTREERFEVLRDIMVQIYKTVFQSESENILKAAMLRTFLYQYKIRLVNSDMSLTEGDRDVLLAMARESENLLNNLEE